MSDVKLINAAEDYLVKVSPYMKVIDLFTKEQLLSAFQEGADWKEMEDLIESTSPIPAVDILLEALAFYQTAFEKKLTESGMGQFTPFLVDRGARATAAMAKYKEALNAVRKK